MASDIAAKIAALRVSHGMVPEAVPEPSPPLSLPLSSEAPQELHQDEDEDDGVTGLLEERERLAHDLLVLQRAFEWMHRMCNLLTQPSIPSAVKRTELAVLNRIMGDYDEVVTDMDVYLRDLDAELAQIHDRGM